jgi:hypothetical protein
VNPFPFNRPLNPHEAVRTRVAGELAERLKSGDHIILAGPRASGKTTTLRQVEHALEADDVAVSHFSVAGMARDDFERWVDSSRGRVLLVDDLDQAPPETAAELRELVDFAPGILAATSRHDDGTNGSQWKLEPLPRAELRDFLVEAFAAADHDAARAVEELLDVTGGHAQRTLQLAHELWEQINRGFRPDDAWKVALRNVRSAVHDGFEVIWASHSQSDRGVLDALAEGQDSLFARETLERFALSKAGASRARGRLLEQGHLRVSRDGSYVIADPLYADWIRRREEPAPPGPDREILRPGAAPFGDPDAARADLDAVMADYVPLGLVRGQRVEPGVSMMTRIVAGRKGAGKTLFLRRLHAAASAHNAVYADVVSSTTPTTSEVVRIASAYRPPAIAEMWTSVWRAAILRATASHMLHAFALARYLDPDIRLALEDLYRQLGSRSSVPRSIGAELRDILAGTPSARMLESYIERYEWDDLAYLLGCAIQDLPPIFFYFDSVDEEFAHAPKQWLDCQVGLVHAVMRLMRDPRLGGRLHVVVSVRDVVLSAILRSEHGTRFAGDPHIETLNWDEPMIRRFLREKVRRLPGSFSTVSAWLGVDRVHDSAGGETDIETYLVRHTRLLPRDITLLGNRLYWIAASAADRGDRISSPEIRAATAIEARSMGIEELALVGNELAAEMMPRDAPDHGYADTYAAGEPLSRELGRAIADALRRLRAWTLTEGRLRDFAAEFAIPTADVLSSLWQHRLLGYREGDEDVYRSAHLDDLMLPAGCREYVMHPVLQAALT